MVELNKIGFYTLSKSRIKSLIRLGNRKPIHRLEYVVTKKCNFSCAYCRGVGEEITFDKLRYDILMAGFVVNARISGGEPTTIPWLIDAVCLLKSRVTGRVAISTNGSADYSLYDRLIKSGVSDFSISLDGCCASEIDKASGVGGYAEKIISNIKKISRRTYCTVGIVITDENINNQTKIIDFAKTLGVSDIRVISSAQKNNNAPIEGDSKYPILSYRANNMASGKQLRGLIDSDTHKCPLVLDDMACMGGRHYPCIIYMREGGKSIGEVDSSFREQRRQWFENTDTHHDKICKNNCLDVCRDYNNACNEMGVV